MAGKFRLSTTMPILTVYGADRDANRQIFFWGGGVEGLILILYEGLNFNSFLPTKPFYQHKFSR